MGERGRLLVCHEGQQVLQRAKSVLLPLTFTGTSSQLCLCYFFCLSSEATSPTKASLGVQSRGHGTSCDAPNLGCWVPAPVTT
jgi:hypothetical protein